MARIFTESFEGDHLLQWSGTRGSGYSLFTTPTIDGAYSARGNGNIFDSVAIYYVLSSSLTEAYVGFFVRNNFPGSAWKNGQPFFELCNGTNQLVGLYTDGTNKLNITLNNSGTVACTGTKILSDATIYHIQLYAKIHSSTGVVTAKIDDTQECTFTGNTDPGARTNFDNFCLGSRSQLSEIQYFCDSLVVNDTTGSTDNSWPGIVRFIAKVVQGPGAYVNNWSRNVGANNWDCVEEIPPDNDTTYLFTSSASTYESFSMNNPVISFANFRALRTMAVVKKDTGTVKLAVGIRDLDNNTDYYSAAQDVGTSYVMVQDRRTLDPSTSLSWTQAGLGNVQALIISSG